jgi:hypothetical protein
MDSQMVKSKKMKDKKLLSPPFHTYPGRPLGFTADGQPGQLFEHLDGRAGHS